MYCSTTYPSTIIIHHPNLSATQYDMLTVVDSKSETNSMAMVDRKAALEVSHPTVHPRPMSLYSNGMFTMLTTHNLTINGTH